MLSLLLSCCLRRRRHSVAYRDPNRLEKSVDEDMNLNQDGKWQPSEQSVARTNVNKAPDVTSSTEEETNRKLFDGLARRGSVDTVGSIEPEMYQRRGSTVNQRCNEGNQAGQSSLLLLFDYNRSDLVVTLVDVKNLVIPHHTVKSTSEVFVKITMEPEVDNRLRQTPLVKYSPDIKFNMENKFPMTFDNLRTHTVRAEYYQNSRIGGAHFLGRVNIDLATIDCSAEVQVNADIEATASGSSCGELQFSLNYVASASRLTVSIIKARDLKRMDITGSSDPYVRVLVYSGPKIKMRKKKTNVIQRSTHPIWNQAMQFTVNEKDLADAKIELVVVDYDLLGHNDTIGHVVISKTTTDDKLRGHWEEFVELKTCNPTWHQLSLGKPNPC